MGVSTDAQLDFGYNLGDDFQAIKEYDDETYSYNLNWYNEDEEDEESTFVHQAYRALYLAIPQDERESAEYSWDQEQVVEDHYGVSFEEHCSIDYPMYVLSACHIVASRGYPETLDISNMTDPDNIAGWSAKLHVALGILGIHPDQQYPAWLLTSYKG